MNDEYRRPERINIFARRLKRILLKKSPKEIFLIFITKPFRFIYSLLAFNKGKVFFRNGKNGFDSSHRTNTGGHLPLYHFSIDSENWIYGYDYKPVDNIDFFEFLKDIDIIYEKFVFIDLGSGKGRALLLASRLPFKKIIGVEFCKELHRIAEDNICCCVKDDHLCNAIESICMDAGSYSFPDEPMVLFMFNPFEPPVIEKVIENLTESFYKNHKRIIIIYYVPWYSDMFDKVEFLTRVKTMKKYHLFDTVPGAYQ